MKDYRVTIKHRVGEITATISTTASAYSEIEAIKTVIRVNNITDVISKKAELLKID